jgi:hypothetical protein
VFRLSVWTQCLCKKCWRFYGNTTSKWYWLTIVRKNWTRWNKERSSWPANNFRFHHRSRWLLFCLKLWKYHIPEWETSRKDTKAPAKKFSSQSSISIPFLVRNLLACMVNSFWLDVILEWRRVFTVMTKHILPYQKRMIANDSDRIHATYSFRTATGRVISSRPNLQNVPHAIDVSTFFPFTSFQFSNILSKLKSKGKRIFWNAKHNGCFYNQFTRGISAEAWSCHCLCRLLPTWVKNYQ